MMPLLSGLARSASSVINLTAVFSFFVMKHLFSDDLAPAPDDRGMFSSRLVLPISCDRLSQAPSREARDATELANAGVLGFLLHGIDVEAMAHPVDEQLAEALAPLHAKLDMIVEMLGKLSYRDSELPPPLDIELGLSRIAWFSSQPWRSEEWLRIKLYFHVTFREPVVVFGQVTHCVEHWRDAGYRIQAGLAEMSKTVGESVARLALLTQRRQRAQRPVSAATRREQ
jgi:hypothetical protein